MNVLMKVSAMNKMSPWIRFSQIEFWNDFNLLIFGFVSFTDLPSDFRVDEISNITATSIVDTGTIARWQRLLSMAIFRSQWRGLPITIQFTRPNWAVQFSKWFRSNLFDEVRQSDSHGKWRGKREREWEWEKIEPSQWWVLPLFTRWRHTYTHCLVHRLSLSWALGSRMTCGSYALWTSFSPRYFPFFRSIYRWSKIVRRQSRTSHRPNYWILRWHVLCVCDSKACTPHHIQVIAFNG